jgi:hypothetical protein
MGSPRPLGVTRGTLRPLIPWYPLGSQAPRPASKAAQFCETSSMPIPPALHGRRATTSRSHLAAPRSTGNAASTGHRQHLFNATARLGAHRQTTASKGGEATVVRLCKGSARQRLVARRAAYGAPTGESPQRSSGFHGTASMPLDPPGRPRSTHQQTTQQPRVTPKRRGVPVIAAPMAGRAIRAQPSCAHYSRSGSRTQPVRATACG